MTLIELLVACTILGGGLLLVAGLYDHYLDQAKAGAARELIAALARAAAVYREATSADPPGRMDTGCDRALRAIRAHPASAAVLKEDSVPRLLTTDGLTRCVDPWGIPVRYLTDRSEHPEHRRRILAGGGNPIFECAGPDRDFGDANPPARLDNLRSDDPV